PAAASTRLGHRLPWLLRRLLNALGLRDVRYHAYDPQHPPLLVEVSATVPLHPNHSTVRAYHAIANLKVRLLRTKSGNRNHKSFSVVWVNHGQYLLTRNVSRLIDPKDLGGFCRAADDVGGSVPLVGEHRSRLRRQLKTVLRSFAVPRQPVFA